MWRNLLLLSLVSVALCCARPLTAHAATLTAGPSDDVESIIGGLSPGDELILEDGTYTLSGRFGFSIAGTEAEPILIRAADGASPHFHRPDASQNIWDFSAEHTIIRGLEFSGGSAGLRIEGARHLTIEDCEIHGTADVALRMNDGGQTYESVQILRNHIHDTDGTGEGMYLGCNEDGCRLVNSIIAENYVHHTNQATVDQGDGIELKEGSAGNVIRDNVIHDTNYPCILTYSAVGNGEPNVIERNLMWNCGDHAIQSAADAVIRNNIILSANANGIAMQPHQNGAPSNLEVVHNTILQATNLGISVTGITGPVLIANNAVYAMSGAAIHVGSGATEMVTLAGNVGVGGLGGAASSGYSDGSLDADFVDASWAGAPPMDVFPAAGGGLVGTGDAAHATRLDFNLTDRGGVADVGAYAFDPAGNPGWILEPDFKDLGGSPPGTDGGTPGSDGGVTGDAGGVPGADGGSGPGVDGGGGPDGGDDGDDGGCGCHTVTGYDASSAAVWLLAIAALLRRRRDPIRRNPRARLRAWLARRARSR